MPTKEEIAATRALLCRKIRLWIAVNPGHTTESIMKVFKLTSEEPLWKMEGMGIIEQEQHDDPRGLTRWRVVPQ